MKFFKVQRCIEDPNGEVFKENIDEYINIDHIVSIEGYVLKNSTHRKGYVLHLSNGRTYNISDDEYQRLLKSIYRFTF